LPDYSGVSGVMPLLASVGDHGLQKSFRLRSRAL
jgi:hypothetical protein